MNNDYKKIIGKNQTRYILEMSSGGASAGASSAASVATVPGVIGGVISRRKKSTSEEFNVPSIERVAAERMSSKTGHMEETSDPSGLGAASEIVRDFVVKIKTDKKRVVKVTYKGLQSKEIAADKAKQFDHPKFGKFDEILSIDEKTTENKTAPKPQNMPAMISRAKTGAGAHRDKKHEMKAGKEKHKKPYAEGHMEPDHEISMASNELESIYLNAKKLLKLLKHYSEMEGLEAWQQSKITKAADYLNSVLQSIRGDHFDVVEAGKSGISKDQETEFHAKLDKLVHDTFGKREVEKEGAENWPSMANLEKDTFGPDSEIWKKHVTGGDGTKEDPYTFSFGTELNRAARLIRNKALTLAGKELSADNFGPTDTKLYYKHNDKLYMGDGTNEVMSANIEQGVSESVAGPKSCWPGHRKVGTQPGTGKNKGKRVNKCKEIGEDVYFENLDAKLKELTTETNKGSRPGWMLREPDVKNQPSELGKKVKKATAPFKAPGQVKETEVSEKAPPGDKYERMVKDIKSGYAKDGKLTKKEKSIAYATAWKAKNRAQSKK